MGSGEDAIFAPLQADGANNKDHRIFGFVLVSLFLGNYHKSIVIGLSGRN